MLIWNLILRFYCPPPFLLLLSVPSDERQLNHWAEKDSCTLCIPKLTSATHSPSCVVATMHSYTHHCDPGALLHSVTVALLYFTFLYYSCTYISNATPDFDKLTAPLCQWSTPYVPVQLPHYRCCSFIHSRSWFDMHSCLQYVYYPSRVHDDAVPLSSWPTYNCFCWIGLLRNADGRSSCAGYFCFLG